MAGTYLAVRPQVNKELKELLSAIDKVGITDTVDVEELHVTLLYAEGIQLEYTPSPLDMYTAVITGVMVLGEGEWQGLVLTLNSTMLQAKFKYFENTFGKVHLYGDLKVHLTIKYKPALLDEAKLLGVLEEFRGKELVLGYEYREDLTK